MKIFLYLLLASSALGASWKMEYSSGTGLKSVPGSEWAAPIPKCNGHINMVTRSPWWGNTPPKTITMVVQLQQQNAHYRGLEPCQEKPPWTGVRFYLQRNGDNMTCSGDYASYRWWSNPVTFRLDPAISGQQAITIKIKPNQWSNCWGKPGTSVPDLFWRAWQNPGRIGVTFGPSCRAGHGVCTDKGKSVFKMVNFK